MRTVLLSLLLFSATNALAGDSPIRFLNPQGLFRPTTFSQIATVENGTLVLISGQTSRDAAGKLVGKDNLRTQTEQVFENLRIALEAIGAGFDDVAKLTTYVVGLKADDRTMIAEVIGKHFPVERRPAHTLIGISALAVEDLLIEVEAVAVLDD
jgi:enamine deaminase RidA (YjgF/YER057c/UK114 family)